MFGPEVSCGLPGDEKSGQVNLQLWGATAYLKARFPLPVAEPMIQLRIAAWGQGNPTAPIVVSVYTDVGGAIGNLVATVQIPASSVPTAATGWTTSVTVPGPFVAGYYWYIASSPASTSTSYYNVYLNFDPSWIDPTARAGYTPPPGQSGNSGWTVVWVLDPTGTTNLTVMPFGLVSSTNQVPVSTFTADSNYQVNCIVPWLSDEDLGALASVSGAFQLEDLTTGQVLGTASMVPAYHSHGIQGLIILQMPSVVDIYAGHEYQVSIPTENPAAVFSVLVRSVIVNPDSFAPGGYWWGGLALGDFSIYRMLDYAGGQETTAPSGIGAYIDSHGVVHVGQAISAVRYVPTAAGTVESFSVKTKSTAFSSTSVLTPPTSFYPAGVPVTVSVYASNESVGAPTYAQPTGSPLASVTVDSGTIPLDGWLTFPGLAHALVPGVPIWFRMSAPNATLLYDLQRTVSPYRFYCLSSENAGGSWGFFSAQGPTELVWKAVMASGAVVGNPFDDGTAISVDATQNFVGQPVLLAQPETISSVFVYSGFRGVIDVTLYPDNGLGTGPNLAAIPYATGSFDATYQYLYSGAIIPLNQDAVLPAGLFWKVYTSPTGALIALAYYWTRPSDPPLSAGLEARITHNGGASWEKYSALEPATMSFLLGGKVGTGVTPPPPPTQRSNTITILGVG